MKRKVVIQAIALAHEMPYDCQYYDVEKRVTFSLLDSGIVTTDKVTEGLKKVNFTPSTPSITLEWDTDYEKKTNHPDVRTLSEFEFWKRCPIVDYPGHKNPNASKKIFLVIVDESEIKNIKAQLVKKRTDAMNKLYKIGESGRKTAATFYGVSGVSTMTEQDVLVALSDWETGLILNPANMYPPAGMSILDHFLDEYDDSSVTVMIRVNVKRALDIGIIKKVNSDDTRPNIFTYMLNNSPIADSDDQLVSYMQNNIDTYDQVIVNGIKTFEKSQQAAASKKTGDKGNIVIDKEDGKSKVRQPGMIERLHAQAVELGIEGYKAMSPPKLSEAIEKALEAANKV